MNKFFFVLVAIILPIIAYSQISKDLTLHISSGVSIPASANDFAKSYRVDTTANSFAVGYSSVERKIIFNDNWNSGFNISCGIGYTISPKLAAILNVNYNSFHLDKSKIVNNLGLSSASYVDDADLIAISFSGNIKYWIIEPRQSFSPYVIAGIGVMNITADDIYILVNTYNNLTYHFNSTNVLNTSLGFGIDLLGGESSSMFIEVKGDVGFTDSGAMYYIPLRIGFRGMF
jgi:opacity protein-like surface antigen